VSSRICILDYGMGNLRSVEKALEHVGAVANSSKMTLHVSVRCGTNAHHMIEASFKAFARALRVAVSIDPEESGVPSTKGTLSE